MPHAVRLAKLPYHPAGHACGKAVRGNVPCDHAARADDTVVPNGHPGADGGVGPDPNPFPDADGSGVHIAPVPGVSEPRVSQIHSAAIRKLKAYMSSYI